MHHPHQQDLSGSKPSGTVIREATVQDHKAVITQAAELRRRSPVPQDAADCQQASQSADQAARQASQSASQSIQQANQSASEAARQASQSASQGIQQAQQSASQSISAASRSAAQAMSSASSVVASIQSSASAAISRANDDMSNAQQSASTAQVEASKAVLQAGAAVAAATGKAAAAGSSFLAAAAKATSSAQASVSAIGAAAASSVSQASQQVTQSQNAAVTATQAALAIVGSVIASALITILIYFLIIRHKQKAEKRSQAERSLSPKPSPDYPADPKFPISEQVGTTIAASQAAYTGTRNEPGTGSQASFSLFPKTTSTENRRDSDVKTTSVPWNPSKPPRAPTLGSWLKVQDGVSPFGPIKLPTDSKSPSPLGGQLKSPLRSINQPRGPNPIAYPIHDREPTLPVMTQQKATVVDITEKKANVVAVPGLPPMRKPLSSEKSTPEQPPPDEKYRESKASVWTDEVPDSGPSPLLQSPPKEQSSATQGYGMTIPSPRNPVRTTAEWLEIMALQNAAETPPSARSSRNVRPSFGLPNNPRMRGGGLPSRPAPNRQAQSVEGDIGYVQGLNRFLPNGRSSTLSRMGSDKSTTSTPGVGKAM